MTRNARRFSGGSFRGAAGFLADLLNRGSTGARYDYMDFYMGTIWVAQRADLRPVYSGIFRRLKGQELDWIYHFPRLALIDFSGAKEQLAGNDPQGFAKYDPEQAFAEEQERERTHEEVARFQAELDEAREGDMRAARGSPPPRVVQAYFEVYGRWPRGWPPG